MDICKAYIQSIGRNKEIISCNIQFFIPPSFMDIAQKTKTFFKEVYVELRKVNWLTRNEVFRYTLIVLAVTVIVSMFLGGLDFIFSELIKKFIVR